MKYHLPKNFKFGVEIEFTQAPLRELCDKLMLQSDRFRAGIDAEEYSIGDVGDYTAWQVCTDYSVTTEGGSDGTIDLGGEVISPVLDVCPTSFREIRNMMKLITKNYGEYTSDTGYHIHVDLNEIDRLVFLGLWFQLSPDIYRVFPDRQCKEFSRSMIRIDPYRSSAPVANQVAALLISNPAIIEEKYNDLHLYERDDERFAEIRCGQMNSEHVVMTAWTKIVLQIVNEAHEYHDIFDLMNADPELNICSLNDRAPRQLKLTKTEKENISWLI